MPMQTDPLNTNPIQQFIQQVKNADASRAKEVKLDINTAKKLAFTLGEAMTRLNGNLEEILITSRTKDSEEIIEIKLDGGTDWK